MISMMISSEIIICLGFNECASNCFLIKCSLTIINFSCSVYEDSSMISNLSRNGSGIPPRSFAVAINKTCDKSYGSSI